MCKDCLSQEVLEYQLNQLADRPEQEACELRNAIITYLKKDEELDTIIGNPYRLKRMREELAEEAEDFDPNNEVDKQFIYANDKLFDALGYYIKVNYGDHVLYGDDEDLDDLS